LIIGFVSAIFFGFISVFYFGNTLRNEIINKVKLFSEAKEGQVYSYLDTLESKTQDFSLDGLIIDNIKKIRARTSLTSTDALNKHLILNKMSLDQTILRIYIMNESGIVIASTYKDDLGIDKHLKDSYKEGKKSVVAVDIEKDEYPDLPVEVLEVAAPIIDKNSGELLGIIVNIFKIDKLEDILSGDFQINQGALSANKGLPKTISIDLVNKEKKVLAHAHKNYKHLTETNNTYPVQRCLDNNEEIAEEYTNQNGNKVIGASMCILKRKWVLVVEIESIEAFAPLFAMQFGLSVFTLIVLFFIIFTAIIASNKISRPIKILHEGTEIIAKGNLDYQVEIKSGDEIELLSNAFNQMTTSLKRSYTEVKKYSHKLEEMVEQKTKDLREKISSLEDAKMAMINVMEDFEEEKNKTTTILNNMGDGMMAMDESGRIVYMSYSAEEMLGVYMEDAVGKHVDELISVVDEKDVEIKSEKNPIQIVLATGKKITTNTTCNYYFISKNKKRFPVAVTASPVFVDKKIVNIILIFRDITHDKDIDRMKTEFISLASHQLRTPLSAMKWFCEMLLNGDAGKLNEEQKEYLDNVYKSNERMISLVNSLLNVSRIESGRIIVDPRPTDLGSLVKEELVELNNKIKEKKMSLIVSIHPELPKINIDPRLIREVYKNFLTNSIKYTPINGEISIYISKKGDEIISQISDTGFGIPINEQKKIFQKLYRGTNILKVETDGTGLGLYLAKSIIDSSGGKVWFKSEEGKGTSFWFSLPVTGSPAKKGEVTIDS